MRWLLFLLISIFLTINVYADEVIHLTLKDVLTRISNDNPQVLMAKQRVRASIEQVAHARSALLPDITGVVSGARQTRDLRASGIALPGSPQIRPFNTMDARIQLTIDLFNPQTVKRLETAHKQKDLSKAQLDQLTEDLLALAAHVYLTARRSQQTVRSVTISYVHITDEFRKSKEALSQGLIDREEFLTVKANKEQVAYQLVRAKQQALETRLDLLAMLSINENVKIYFDDELLITVPTVTQKSTQLRLAEVDLSLAQAKKAHARTGYFPSIQGMGDLGYAGEDFNHSSRVYTVGIQARFPLFEGGQTRADINEAKAFEEERLINLNDIKLREALAEVKYRRNIEAMKALVRFKKSERKAAEQVFASIQQRYREGIVDRVALKSSEAAFAHVVDEYQEALSLYQLAHIQLAHQLGLMRQL